VLIGRPTTDDVHVWAVKKHFAQQAIGSSNTQVAQEISIRNTTLNCGVDDLLQVCQWCHQWLALPWA
jgi:MarR-like DNA-binding transcriptional regulator SgrR of sgrS sRNA